jgi:hypothetical protein
MSLTDDQERLLAEAVTSLAAAFEELKERVDEQLDRIRSPASPKDE